MRRSRFTQRLNVPKRTTRLFPCCGLASGLFEHPAGVFSSCPKRVSHRSSAVPKWFFRSWLDRNGNGLDDVEHHTLRLFEALCPYAMGSVQRDAVGQHDRRQFFDVVGETIVASTDDR